MLNNDCIIATKLQYRLSEGWYLPIERRWKETWVVRESFENACARETVGIYKLPSVWVSFAFSITAVSPNTTTRFSLHQNSLHNHHNGSQDRHPLRTSPRYLIQCPSSNHWKTKRHCGFPTSSCTNTILSTPPGAMSRPSPRPRPRASKKPAVPSTSTASRRPSRKTS